MMIINAMANATVKKDILNTKTLAKRSGNITLLKIPLLTLRMDLPFSLQQSVTDGYMLDNVFKV